MKTDDFISALAADLPSKPMPVRRALSLAALAATPIALAIVIFGLKVRPDIADVLVQPRMAFKFAVMLAMTASGAWLALRLSRPEPAPGRAVLALGITAALIFVGVVTEMVVLPTNLWKAAFWGDSAFKCLVLIPLVSTAPFVAFMMAMKTGAPSNPALAGAAAGLLSSGLGATLYATHCQNDSPLYIATWYVLGILIVTFAGAVIGSRLLKW
jgi:hypothetical protein